MHLGADGRDAHLLRAVEGDRPDVAGLVAVGGDGVDLRLHQALNPVQAAVDPFGQHIVPDPACPIGSGAADEARAHLGADLFVLAGTLAQRPRQPGMEARTRDTQRCAQPCHRPDAPVLRNEREPHVTSFAK